MRLLVTGSRTWPESQKQLVLTVLEGFSYVHEGVTIIAGESKGGGVDTYVKDWAEEYEHYEGYPVEEAEYAAYQKAAPRFRNERMVNMSLPDFVIAFYWQHETNGTHHCYEYATQKGIPGLVVVGGVC